MTATMSAEDRLTSIEKLLDREREELRAGRFDRLDKLIGERENHVEALRGQIERSDTPVLLHLRQVQAKAQRNARLISAAKNGLDAGNRRVAEIVAVREKLSTYSENGQVSDIMRPSSRVQKKA